MVLIRTAFLNFGTFHNFQSSLIFVCFTSTSSSFMCSTLSAACHCNSQNVSQRALLFIINKCMVIIVRTGNGESIVFSDFTVLVGWV